MNLLKAQEEKKKRKKRKPRKKKKKPANPDAPPPPVPEPEEHKLFCDAAEDGDMAAMKRFLEQNINVNCKVSGQRYCVSLFGGCAVIIQ